MLFCQIRVGSLKVGLDVAIRDALRKPSNRSNSTESFVVRS